MSITLPGLYVSLLVYHQELLPVKLALSISASRQGVPFPTYLECLLLLTAFEVLREAGANVLGIASIFTYGLQKGLDRLAAANVINHSLSNFETLVKVAAEENYISNDDINKVLKFQKNPSDPFWME